MIKGFIKVVTENGEIDVPVVFNEGEITFNPGDNLEHKDIPAEQVHIPFSYKVSSLLDLETLETDLNDNGKIALVTDTDRTFLRVNGNWKEFIMDGDGTNPTGPSGGSLSGFYPNPIVLPDSHRHTPGITIPSYPTNLPPSGLAGGDLEGNYPNPSLKKIIQGGIYQNPTLKIDEKGRVEEVTSNELPIPLFYNNEISYLESEEIEIQQEEKKLKLKIKDSLVNNSSGNNWSPDLSKGKKQIFSFNSENSYLDEIINYQIGSEFIFIIHLVFETISVNNKYKFNNTELKQGLNIIRGIIYTDTIYLCKVENYFSL